MEPRRCHLAFFFFSVCEEKLESYSLHYNGPLTLVPSLSELLET